MEFNERTIKVIIDEEKCEGCKTHTCVAACKTYSRGILILKNGRYGVCSVLRMVKTHGDRIAFFIKAHLIHTVQGKQQTSAML